MLKKLLTKLLLKADGKKVHGIAAVAAITAVAQLAGHPVPYAPAMTDGQAWTVLYSSGLVSAFRDAIRKVIEARKN